MKRVLFLLLICATVFSCSSDNDTDNYFIVTVASKRVYCMENPQCYIVKGERNEWRVFAGWIEHFEYEEGYEYVVEVKEVPIDDEGMVDVPSSYWILREVISKEKKESENLPEWVRCL